MRIRIAAAVLPLFLSLTACTVSTETGDEVGATTKASQTLMAGCGACSYGLESAEGCPLAVEVDGTPMLVTGSDFHAMDAGLCIAKAKVEIVGEVQGDKFAATSVKLAD